SWAPWPSSSVAARRSISSKASISASHPARIGKPVIGLLLRRPLPALERLLPRAGDAELVGRRVLADHRAGADGRVPADGHRRHQRRIGADEGAILDGGDELVDAVVVAGDGAGADIDAAADHRIAEIG